ncbi:hypothetical protein SRHO_G00113010 [Serrasalmus rhombeus]
MSPSVVPDSYEQEEQLGGDAKSGPRPLTSLYSQLSFASPACMMGHMGVDRTLDLVRARFYWPKMAMDIERKVRTCGRFFKFAVAIPTPNQKARTVAKCLWENFMVYYGIPEKLHSDQRPDFESRTIRELCQVASIHKVRTTPYHPRDNPVEQFNRTLLDILGTLQDKDKTCWRDHVRPLVHAYNCTRNEVTGFTPYELMFTRQSRLPVDLAFKLPVQEGQHSSHSEYVQNLKSRLKESYKIAMEKAAKIAHKNKTRFDRHVIASDLEAGDRALVRNVRICGKHKISDKWEHTIHVVLRRAGTLPVYTVKPEKGDGPVRTLHRDLLLPFCENPVLPDPPTTNVQDTQHTEPPGIRPVENPVNAQNFDNTPDVDNPPDISSSTSDDPLIFVQSNLHETDTDYLPIDRVTPTEQADETLSQNDLTEDDFPNVQREQLPVTSNMSDIDEEKDGIRGAEPGEKKEETDRKEGSKGWNSPNGYR